MAEGFEPSHGRINSAVPYHLATPQELLQAWIWLRRRDSNSYQLVYKTSALGQLSYTAILVDREGVKPSQEVCRTSMLSFTSPARRSWKPAEELNLAPFRPALKVRFRRPMPGTRATCLEATVRFELTHCCLRNSRSGRWSYIASEQWSGREADAPLPSPRSRQSPFCRDEPRPDNSREFGAQGRTQTFNLWFVGPALHQLSYSGLKFGARGESRTHE